MNKIKTLGQVMTPQWAADELVAQYFGDLSGSDFVIEPSCGTGAFLRAIPAHVPSVGVEIDRELAAVAAKASGREIIVGDFRDVDLPFKPTAIIGNPPFALRTCEGFLERAHALLPDEGRVGLILPCFVLQTAATVERWNEHWSLSVSLIPRNVFRLLSKPLCFARLTKGSRRTLVNLALYHETAQVNRLRARYRAILEAGEGSVWSAVVRAAFDCLGGTATLDALYREIEGNRPTQTQWWRAKVRQVTQRIATRVADATWSVRDDLFACPQPQRSLVLSMSATT